MVSVTEKVLPKKYANKSNFSKMITISLGDETVIANQIQTCFSKSS